MLEPDADEGACATWDETAEMYERAVPLIESVDGALRVSRHDERGVEYRDAYADVSQERLEELLDLFDEDRIGYDNIDLHDRPSKTLLRRLRMRYPRGSGVAVNEKYRNNTANVAREPRATRTRAEIKELFVRLTREVGPRCQKDDGWIGCDEIAYYVAEALREHGIDARYVEGDASYGGHGEPTEHAFHVWIAVEDMVLDPKSLLLRDAGASHWRYWNYEESFLDEPPKRTRFATVPLDDAYVPDPLEDLEVLVRALGDTELFDRAGSEFIRALTDDGFHVLGIGGSRIVVALDADRVAKIDAQPDGPNNANERDVWDDYGETGLLAPIIDERADGRILVMRRAAPFEGPADASGRVASVPRRLRKKLDAAKEELSELLGPDFVDPSYDFNWGLLDGRLVCIDYAS
jgi:hypothetical protein